MPGKSLIPTLAWILVLVACSGDAGTDPDDLPTDLEIRPVPVATGLDRPVQVVSPPGDPRNFVVEQAGRIVILDDGKRLPTPFLDLTSRVSSAGEQGLLSVAFHPDFKNNRYFFVNYTAPDGATRVERYRAASPDRADPSSAHLIITVPQPFTNHNGGMIAFGPDGMLYIGMGDGGFGGDPRGHGQNPGTLLGAMLRIDIDRGDPYAIPVDNPFVGQPGMQPEIWATGLRNPWRFSFDPPAGLLYIADVGQSSREEINARRANEGGLNYGWNIMEGSTCFRPSSGCNRSGLVLPIAEYGRDEGCSITGGYVYRGTLLPELTGHYFYSDYCSGRVRSLRYVEGGEVTEQRVWNTTSVGSVTSFGVDSAGELLVVVQDGTILRLEN